MSSCVVADRKSEQKSSDAVGSNPEDVQSKTEEDLGELDEAGSPDNSIYVENFLCVATMASTNELCILTLVEASLGFMQPLLY